MTFPHYTITMSGRMALAWVAILLTMGFLIGMLSGCSSNPRDDDHIVDCGDGYYVKPGQRCP
jgi:hypothetical protein